MFFNAQHLSAPSLEYVAWFDVMGTQASMSRSISATANFIFKLHIAALEARLPGVSLYPVMDGVYATSPDQHAFLSFLRDAFKRVAEEFVDSDENHHRFVIRGGLAFGRIYHGRDVGQGASPILAKPENLDYRRQILLGMPVVQAHLSEALAPPFGLFVHESARAFAPAHTEPLHLTWWHWKNQSSAPIWDSLQNAMQSYYEWCGERAEAIQYPADRISRHKDMYAQLCHLAG